MQRRAVELFLPFSLVLIALSFAGCGGGGSNKVGPATTITITPTTASIEFGKFVTLVAAAKDASGKTVDPATITWSSSNTAFATVTASGANGSVCAGTWDSLTSPTVCTPATIQASITITAKSGSASATATIDVHPHVARLVVTPPTSACLSQGQTLQMNAQAFDSSNNPIPTTPASFTWTSGDNNIVTIDASGVATANKPGLAGINASLSATTGLPVPFITCPPSSISLSSQNVTPVETAFTLAPGSTKAMSTVANDTNGNPFNSLTLTYSSLNPSVASITGSGFSSTVTASSPGATTVIASCTPPSCNPGPNKPYYSFPVTVTVTGPTAQKLVVTAPGATGVVIVDTSNGSSTPVAFPTTNGQVPRVNSLLVAGDGSVAYLGSDLGILRIDLNNNVFLSTLNGSGVVRALSPKGDKVLATNAGGPVYLYDLSANQLFSFSTTGVTAADFSIDGLKAFMVAGSSLNVLTAGSASVAQQNLSGSASDVKFSPQSSVAVAAEGTGEVIAICSNSALPTLPGPVGTLLGKTNVANRMWGADGSHIYQIDFSGNYATTSFADCRPQVDASSTPFSLGASVTPLQLVAMPSGQAAYLVNSSSNLYVATSGGSGTTAIALTGGGTPLAAAATPDSASVYVAASTGDLHRIDTSSNADVQQIPISLKAADGSAVAPTLIGLRTK